MLFHLVLTLSWLLFLASFLNTLLAAPNDNAKRGKRGELILIDPLVTMLPAAGMAFGLLSFSGGVFFLFRNQDQGQDLMSGAGFAIVGILLACGGLLASRSFKGYFMTVDDKSIVSYIRKKRRSSIDWTEVRRVDFNKKEQLLIISSDHASISIDTDKQGFREFLEMIRSKINPSLWNSALDQYKQFVSQVSSDKKLSQRWQER